MTTVLQQLNAEMGDLVEKVKHSMVQVRTSGGEAGAGTIWHSDGLILTNAHVVRRGPLQAVLPDGSTLPAKLLAHDTSLDLAALAVDSSGLPASSGQAYFQCRVLPELSPENYNIPVATNAGKQRADAD